MQQEQAEKEVATAQLNAMLAAVSTTYISFWIHYCFYCCGLEQLSMSSARRDVPLLISTVDVQTAAVALSNALVAHISRTMH
jgi:NADH:ubiquinone oxidoreductase subunit B-like Fe-S oxidoreductase